MGTREKENIGRGPIRKVRTCVHHKEEEDAPNLPGRNKKQILTNMKEIAIFQLFQHILRPSLALDYLRLPPLENMIWLGLRDSEN